MNYNIWDNKTVLRYVTVSFMSFCGNFLNYVI